MPRAKAPNWKVKAKAFLEDKGFKNPTEEEIDHVKKMWDCRTYKYDDAAVCRNIQNLRNFYKDKAKKDKLKASLPALKIGGFQFWPDDPKDNDNYFDRIPTPDDYAFWKDMHKKHPDGCKYFGMLMKGRDKNNLTLTPEEVAEYFKVPLATFRNRLSKLKKDIKARKAA